MLNKLRSLLLKYPVPSGIIIMLSATALTEIHVEGSLAGMMGLQKASYLTGIIEQGTVSVLLIILLAWLGMLKEGGFTHPKSWRYLWLIWPILIFSFLNGGTSPIDGTLTIDTGQPGLIVLFFLLYISVGFFEEILFRSVILSLMLREWGSSRKGIILAVLVSCSIFGLLHLVNLAMGRRTVLATATQIVYGIFFGVFFAGCFLRNRTIWPVIFAHALFDLSGNFEAISVGGSFGKLKDVTPRDALISVIVTFPLLLYGLFVLRKVKPDQKILEDPSKDPMIVSA